MHELLDAAGATLCDPLLIILLAVMMIPSGGSSYVFSGKTDDVGFLLLKARAAARKIPCAHWRSAQGAQAFILRTAARQSDRAKRASGAYWGASGAPPYGAGERERIKNIRGRCSMRAGILYSTAAPDIFYSASFARKPGSPVSERREGQLPSRDHRPISSIGMAISISLCLY